MYSVERGSHGDWLVRKDDQTLGVYANNYTSFVFALARAWDASGRDVRALAPETPAQRVADHECDSELEALMQTVDYRIHARSMIRVASPSEGSYRVTLTGQEIDFTLEPREGSPIHKLLIPLDDVPQVLGCFRQAASDVRTLVGEFDAVLCAYAKHRHPAEYS